MATRMMATRMATLPDLRYEPTQKRVRAMIDDTTVVDSTRAVLIWEPRRIVPSYAVPREDVTAELTPSEQPTGETSADAGFRMPDLSHIPVLDPSIPFQMHSTAGTALDLRTDTTQARRGVAFELADPELEGYVHLDFKGFDEWLEEDEPIISHPRDPFSRIDTRQSSRTVRIELDGIVLAESTRPLILFETGLPVRYYLPREDIRATMHPSATRTTCAYKGEASHWSVEVGDRVVADLVWSYPAPLRDRADVGDLFCFYDERVDLVVDGQPRERPVTPWS